MTTAAQKKQEESPLETWERLAREQREQFPGNVVVVGAILDIEEELMQDTTPGWDNGVRWLARQ